MVPLLVAVAVEVTDPTVTRPPNSEIPLAVAVAVAVAVGPEAPLDDVEDSPSTERRAPVRAAGSPSVDEPSDGRVGRDGSDVSPSEGAEPSPATGASVVAPGEPKVAVAVLAVEVQAASMVTPGVGSSEASGPCGQVDVACTGHTGAAGRGTPGRNSPSSGPALATTCPGYRLEARALPEGPTLSAVAVYPTSTSADGLAGRGRLGCS